MKLYRLIYKSTVAEYIDWADLKDILTKSKENNVRLDITGLLVMTGQTFVQVLEGPGPNLNMLYTRILQDSRHDNSQLLSYTPIHERHFGRWAMQGIHLTRMNPDLKAWLTKKYGLSGDSILVPDDPFLAYSLLYDIYCDSNG